MAGHHSVMKCLSYYQYAIRANFPLLIASDYCLGSLLRTFPISNCLFRNSLRQVVRLLKRLTRVTCNGDFKFP